jgi:hypothetical protein
LYVAGHGAGKTEACFVFCALNSLCFPEIPHAPAPSSPVLFFAGRFVKSNVQITLQHILRKDTRSDSNSKKTGLQAAIIIDVTTGRKPRKIVAG